MKYVLKRSIKKPSLYSKNNIVTNVNDEFIKLTGYCENQLKGKSLSELSNLLKIDSKICLENIEDKYCCYLFSNEYEAKEVIISSVDFINGDEKVFYFKEIRNSSVERKLPFALQLLNDNVIGVAVFSLKDGILLKANEKYIEAWYGEKKKYENVIGKTLEGTLPGYIGSNLEKIIKEILKTKQSFYSSGGGKEYIRKDDSYYDLSLTPIHIDGEPKFLIHTTHDITENIIKSDIIEEQEEELEAIIENMSDGLHIVDTDYNLSLINSSSRYSFYQHNVIKNLKDTLKYTQYFDSEGNQLTLEEFPEISVLMGERIKEYRITCNRPDGIFHFNVSGSPVYDKNGKVIKAIMCSRDVTERVNKDDLLRMNKEQLESIIENMSDALVLFDKDGNITKVNKSARKSVFKFEEGKKMNDHFDHAKIYDLYWNEISKENSAISRILKGEKLLRYKTIIKVDDTCTYTEANGNPIYDKNDNFIGGVLVVYDITDRIKSEETLLLKTQYSSLSRIIEDLDVGFARFSFPDLEIIDFNQKYFNQLKLIKPELGSPNSMNGEDFFNICILDEKSEIMKNIRNLIKKRGDSYVTNSKFIMAGEERFFRIIRQPLFGLNNQMIELLQIVIDITEEVTAKNKMEETLRIQEEIFSNISHELKTPLNVIFSTNQLMELYLKNDCIYQNIDKVSKSINIIKQNCYRFTKLINNIVDASKIDSGFFQLNLSNENIVTVIEDIIQSISEYIKGKGLSIIFDTNVEEKIIACDPDKIERIVLNLVSNAIKFSNPDGKIFVNVVDKGELVEITVEDTGIGIDSKHLDNIFERFHQVDKSLSRNAEGSGIGLSLVKSIVEMHGGNICVKSQVNKGSTFKIVFPVKNLEKPKVVEKANAIGNKIEMINIEFSDIYLI